MGKLLLFTKKKALLIAFVFAIVGINSWSIHRITQNVAPEVAVKGIVTKINNKLSITPTAASEVAQTTQANPSVDSGQAPTNAPSNSGNSSQSNSSSGGSGSSQNNNSSGGSSNNNFDTSTSVNDQSQSEAIPTTAAPTPTTVFVAQQNSNPTPTPTPKTGGYTLNVTSNGNGSTNDVVNVGQSNDANIPTGNGAGTNNIVTLQTTPPPVGASVSMTTGVAATPTPAGNASSSDNCWTGDPNCP